MEEKRQLLLHSCCGPCSTAVIERLISDYEVTVFFCNPNIDDPEEYQRRKETQLRFIEAYKRSDDCRKSEHAIHFMEGDYQPQAFHQAVAGCEEQPEGGERCIRCFYLRLSQTANAAKAMGIPRFATTLTVSPHKSYPQISQIGQTLARERGLEFLDMDFKKKAGYQRSVELSREYGLYRQSFCGCSYGRAVQERQMRQRQQAQQKKPQEQQTLQAVQLPRQKAQTEMP